jgi:ATP-dependent exoDNAse (exonuclease V) beta subunit
MLPNSTVSDQGFEGTEIWQCDGFDQTAEWIADLCEEHPPNDIAVLVRMGYQIAELNHRLEALGVPVRTVGTGRNYFLRLEVRDLANVLEALCDPTNDFALLAVLRSPIVGISLDSVVKIALSGDVSANLRNDFSLSNADQEKLNSFADWFESVSSNASRLSAWEVLSQLFAQTPYWENLVQKPNGRQQLANVRKLFMMATERPQLNPRQFAKLLRELQTLDIREGDAGAIDDGVQAVTIMTVHRSKGLEFPVVVLPATRDKLKRNKTSFEIDRDYGIIAFKPSKCASAICDWIAVRRQEMEMAEELRALYVAMTRSQKKLCIVANPKGNGSLGQLIWNSLQPDSSLMPGLRIRRAPTLEEPA